MGDGTPATSWRSSVLRQAPTPTYAQYPCTALPFIVVAAVRFLSRLGAEVGDDRVRARRHGQAFGLRLAIYVVVTPLGVYQFTVDEVGVLPVDESNLHERRSRKNWSIGGINAVGHAVDDVMPATPASVISWWPGYFVESRTSIFPRLENPFAMWYAVRLSPEQIARYQFMHPTELVSHLRRHTAPVVVLGNRLLGARPYFRNLVIGSGYVMVRKLGDTEIYRWGDHGR